MLQHIVWTLGSWSRASQGIMKTQGHSGIWRKLRNISEFYPNVNDNFLNSIIVHPKILLYNPRKPWGWSSNKYRDTTRSLGSWYTEAKPSQSRRLWRWWGHVCWPTWTSSSDAFWVGSWRFWTCRCQSGWYRTSYGDGLLIYYLSTLLTTRFVTNF